ncbi:MAG: hypothetical protein ACK4K6_15930, partial [Pseudarthrobacter sp.]
MLPDERRLPDPIPAGAVVTPSAKDRARELGVSLQVGNGSVVPATAVAAAAPAGGARAALSAPP